MGQGLAISDINKTSNTYRDCAFGGVYITQVTCRK